MVYTLNGKPIVVLEDVVKVYRVGNIVTYALRGVNLIVRKGEFVAIMGPSGSGKTTLLNMIGLLDKPTKGKVIIDGVDTSRLKSKELAYFRNRKIGFIFQHFNLISRLTVLENIELPLVARGIPRNIRIKKAKEALIKAGGDLSWLNKKPTQLSGGQQQRVAIARALVGDPEILLADEPTGNLDRASSKIVLETFLKLNSQGQTIITVTHDPEVAHCTQRILIIRDGKIVEEKKPDFTECIVNKI
ncbi:MAG: ABC transporter ATP-binding protein [Thermoprotei archaeon]|mgnify:CR=1 FL=1|nr:MAG: ABC transporter ATP-binding protein [Thermoprotei archaeon]